MPNPLRKKGEGFLGVLDRPDGGVSTELSIGVNFDGKEREIPTLVPTLTNQEVQHLIGGGKPTEGIIAKAVTHARERISEGKNPFAQKGEQNKRSPTMPNPLADVFNILFRGTPETGRGLLSPGNIADAAKMPAVDLGRINITAPAQAETLPKTPLPPTIPEQKTPQDQRSNLMSMLINLGIPLATTGIGMGVPGALPAAAGFQQGFAKGIQKEGQKEVAIVDDDGNIQTVNLPPSVSKVLKKSGRKPTDFELQKEARIRASRLFDPTLPPSAEEYQEKIQEQLRRLKGQFGMKQGEEKVTVQDAKGNQFLLPRNQLQEAQRQGYTLVQ